METFDIENKLVTIRELPTDELVIGWCRNKSHDENE
jgi:hypothetical protein